MSVERLVWLVEDDQDDAEECIGFLEQFGTLKVEPVSVEFSIEAYDHLLADKETGAFIIDQRLYENIPGIPYTGIDLAEYLRVRRPELPIFILTNYPRDGELLNKGYNADSIIDKGDVGAYAQNYIYRILRSMGEYDRALTEKQQQLKGLIDKKLLGELTVEETEHLRALRSDLERPFERLVEEDAKELVQLAAQEERLKKLEQILKDIKKAFDGER
ncbi:MAG: hypothetical protein HGA45_06800 [Chloroflexales bacterium]|nr:hypothetical protein [Chloroflexales bacterium]